MVGIDDRHLYGVAMAIALGTVAVGGVFLGIRTTFAPADGPVLLIFAFEAVIIGGLGSLWGTLVGGIILGVSQTVGGQINPAYQILAGPPRLPGDPRSSGRGPVPAARARARHDRRRADAATGVPGRARHATTRAASWSAVAAGRRSRHACPRGGPSGMMRLLVEFLTLLAMAQMWNLLAGYAGPRVDRPAGVRRASAPTACTSLTDRVGLPPSSAIAVASRSRRRSSRSSPRSSPSGCAAATSRSGRGSSPRSSGCIVVAARRPWAPGPA